MPHLNKGHCSSLVRPCSPVQGVRADLGIEEHFVGAFVLDMQGVVFIDEDAGEERLVAQASVRVVAVAIDVCAVLEQVERVVQVLACLAVLAVVRGQALLDLVQFAREGLLFSFEVREGDRVGVERL
ncbi:hypothetical protein AB3K78_07080 [Leucobacter sp. HNU]|uniref:hypothetical protein n=1 Tax=Leucobacter sp. HNU TaxID=3236805 RepID=UPI003A810E78